MANEPDSYPLLSLPLHISSPPPSYQLVERSSDVQTPTPPEHSTYTPQVRSSSDPSSNDNPRTGLNERHRYRKILSWYLVLIRAVVFLLPCGLLGFVLFWLFALVFVEPKDSTEAKLV